MNQEHALVQPIIVDPATPANILIRDAAVAAVLAMQTIEHPNWKPWKAAKFTKSVRKVKPAHLASWADEWGWTTYGSAAAGAPMEYNDYPSKLRKARVEGWGDDVLPWVDENTDDADILITLNGDLNMTPGKASAQAAHALMRLALARPVDLGATVIKVGQRSFSEFKTLPAGTIIDSGLTEIAPYSPTAFITARH